MRQEEFIHVGVEAAFFGDDVPELDALQGVDDGFVGDGCLGVGVEAHRAGEEVGVLGHADDAGADLLPRDGGDVDAVDGDGAAAELDHPEDG